MTTIKLLIVSLVMLSAFQTFAKDSSSGCGLGWMAFKRNTLVSSSFRATTHAILPSTFSMTFGTSGCAYHDIVMNEKKGIHYAESNYHQLMIDVARGEGEYLEGFAHATGYIGDIKIYGKIMQKNYNNLYNNESTTASKMYKQYKMIMTNNV